MEGYRNFPTQLIVFISSANGPSTNERQAQQGVSGLQFNWL